MRLRLTLSLIFCAAFLSACGPSSDKQASQQNSSDGADSGSDKQDSQSDDSQNNSARSADTARQNAIEALQDQTYEDVMGVGECTEDCSGHNAGWEWAKEHQVFDPDDCSGNSDSFIEGCKAYGEEV